MHRRRASSARSQLAITLSAMLLTRCHGDLGASLQNGTFESREVPAGLAAKVSRFAYVERFEKYWRSELRYTLRADGGGPDAGCSFVRWISGAWKVEGGTLVVTPDPLGSGSVERYDCPGHADPTTVESNLKEPPLVSPLRLEGRKLTVQRALLGAPSAPLVLTRR